MTKKTRKRPSPSIPAPAVNPLLVDLKAAASLLSCTLWSVRQLLSGNKLPFIKIGRRFLIDPEDLRQFITRQKGGAA